MELGDGANLFDIHRSFAATEHGQTLAGRVRWERYKPAEVSNAQWIDLLGADVNNLTHLPLTYGLTRSMVSGLRESLPGFLSTHEEEVLQMAALIHDWAESIVGDTTYSDKTAEHEAEEQAHLQAILAGFNARSSSVIYDLIQEAAENVVFNDESKLGMVFNTIERVGYIRTASRAGIHVINGKAPDCHEAFRWMVADAFGNSLALLTDRSVIYPPLEQYLRNHSLSINASIGIVHPDTFDNYPEHQRLPKVQAFVKATRVWGNWMNSQRAA